MLIIRRLPKSVQAVIYLVLGALACVAAVLTGRDGYPAPAVVIGLGGIALWVYAGYLLKTIRQSPR